MSADADVGAGATITFASSWFSAVIQSIEWSGMSRGAVETTDMETVGGETFIPTDTYNPGELDVTMFFDDTNSGNPPITSAPEACTVTFPSGKTYSASAFLQDFGVSLPDPKEAMTCSARLKFSGNITFAVT